MQIENDYDREVYNGDIGFVEDVEPEEGELTVRFDGRSVTYGFGELEIARVPGSAVFLTRADIETPPVLVWHVRKNRSPHEYVIILKLGVTSSPRTKSSERLQIESIADKLWRIEARHGSMERPNVLAVLDDCRTKGVEMKRDDVTFYVGHETIIPREGHRGIPRWQEAIFAAMARNSVRITDVLKLPHNQVVEIGREVAI
jgi:KUP system potassium uptake protein